jgi:hypothetical protein
LNNGERGQLEAIAKNGVEGKLSCKEQRGGAVTVLRYGADNNSGIVMIASTI